MSTQSTETQTEKEQSLILKKLVSNQIETLNNQIDSLRKNLDSISLQVRVTESIRDRMIEDRAHVYSKHNINYDQPNGTQSA